MTTTPLAKIHQQHLLSVVELAARYEEVCGEAPRSRHRAFLKRRIAWNLQLEAKGGLSPDTECEITRLIATHDPLQREATRARTSRQGAPARRKVRPRVGTVITRLYKGDLHEVTVVQDGFAYEGEVFRSLSAVARRITGAHWNGPLFFGMR